MTVPLQPETKAMKLFTIPGSMDQTAADNTASTESKLTMAVVPTQIKVTTLEESALPVETSRPTVVLETAKHCLK